MYLLQVCNDVSRVLQFDPAVSSSISGFSREVLSMQMDIEQRLIAAEKGKENQIKEKLKWIMFDHSIPKFLESLNRWNMVFPNAATAPQL